MQIITYHAASFWTRFSKYFVSGSLAFSLFRVNADRKNRIILAMLVQITKMLSYTVLNSATARQFMQLPEDFELLWLASGQNFQNTPCPEVPQFLFSVFVVTFQ